MVANLQSDPNEVTRESITACVEGYISSGEQPNDAFRKVFEDLDLTGRLIDLARLLGPHLVGEIWRSRNSALRPANVGFEFRRPSTPTTDMSDVPQRRVPVTTVASPSPVLPIPTLAAKALVDGLYKIGGQWVRLGDMNKALCHAAFKQYRASAMSDEHNARYFRALEEALGEGEVVGQRFDDEKLMRIYRLAKP